MAERRRAKTKPAGEPGSKPHVVSPRIASGPPSAALEDRILVRAFILSDWAETSSSAGKLNIGGGGVTGLTLAPGVNAIPNLHLSIRLHVPRKIAGEQLDFVVRVVDSDGLNVRPVNLIQGSVRANMAEHNTRGEVPLGFTVPLAGYRLPPDKDLVYFELEVGGKLVSVLPLNIERAAAEDKPRQRRFRTRL